MKLAVEEKLAGGKVRMDYAFAMNEHDRFYNPLCQLNTAFIGYIVMAP
jgi:hypothetical protein